MGGDFRATRPATTTFDYGHGNAEDDDDNDIQQDSNNAPAAAAPIPPPTQWDRHFHKVVRDDLVFFFSSFLFDPGEFIRRGLWSMPFPVPRSRASVSVCLSVYPTLKFRKFLKFL